jgi:hypothetical protein
MVEKDKETAYSSSMIINETTIHIPIILCGSTDLLLLLQKCKRHSHLTGNSSTQELPHFVAIFISGRMGDGSAD